MASIDLFTSSATVEWGTPPEIPQQINERYPIVLDVCATPGREIAEAYFAPPLDEIGKYAVKINGEKIIKVDEAFKAAALHHALNVRAPKAIDALAQDWAAWLAFLGGCAFMNPPFGRLIKAFIQKTWEEANKGACIAAIIPSRTGTSWWHRYVEPVRKGLFPGEFEFFEGRISFITREGKKPAPAPFDMAKVVWDGRLLKR